jgi:hypothetical protein
MNKVPKDPAAMTDMSNTGLAAMPLTGISPCSRRGRVTGGEHGTLLERIGRGETLRLMAAKKKPSVSTDAMPPLQRCLK